MSSKFQLKLFAKHFHPDVQLTEARVLDRVSVVVVDLVAALALVADDSLRGAVAPARLVVAVGGLAVALAGCKETQFKNQIFLKISTC